MLSVDNGLLLYKDDIWGEHIERIFRHDLLTTVGLSVGISVCLPHTFLSTYWYKYPWRGSSEVEQWSGPGVWDGTSG